MSAQRIREMNARLAATWKDRDKPQKRLDEILKEEARNYDPNTVINGKTLAQILDEAEKQQSFDQQHIIPKEVSSLPGEISDNIHNDNL